MTTFAIIDSRDITELGRHKASGCAWALYTALMTFARGTKANCFPSINTLSELIGGAYSEAGIFKALKWLESKKFIKRNDKRSKQRFIMLRKFVNAVSTKVESDLHSTKVECKNKIKNKLLFKKGKNKIKSRFKRKKQRQAPIQSTQNEADKEIVSKADVAWSSWSYRGGNGDVSKLSEAERFTIVESLNSQAPEDVEWREAMSWSNRNKLIFDKLLSS